MCYYSLANEVAKGYSNATLLPLHPCEHSRINILQWILTKLGTYLVLKRIWNPIDFQGHRVKYLGEGICHALHCPCLSLKLLTYCACTFIPNQHACKIFTCNKHLYCHCLY